MTVSPPKACVCLAYAETLSSLIPTIELHRQEILWNLRNSYSGAGKSHNAGRRLKKTPPPPNFRFKMRRNAQSRDYKGSNIAKI